jgi:hypothetical protein
VSRERFRAEAASFPAEPCTIFHSPPSEARPDPDDYDAFVHEALRRGHRIVLVYGARAPHGRQRSEQVLGIGLSALRDIENGKDPGVRLGEMYLWRGALRERSLWPPPADA